MKRVNNWADKYSRDQQRWKREIREEKQKKGQLNYIHERLHTTSPFNELDHFFLSFCDFLLPRVLSGDHETRKKTAQHCVESAPKPSSYFEDEILRSMKSTSPVRRRWATTRFFEIQHILMLRHTVNINEKPNVILHVESRLIAT